MILLDTKAQARRQTSGSSSERSRMSGYFAEHNISCLLLDISFPSLIIDGRRQGLGKFIILKKYEVNAGYFNAN